MLPFFPLDAAQKDSPNVEHMSFICVSNEGEYGMSRNFADVSQTIQFLTETYRDLGSAVNVSCNNNNNNNNNDNDNDNDNNNNNNKVY